MSIPVKKENQILWMNEVNGVISRLVKFPNDIMVVQQLHNGVWGTQGITEQQLQDVWNSIRSSSKVPAYLDPSLVDELLAAEWRKNNPSNNGK